MIMKTIILLILCLGFAIANYAQCNCETIKRDDGNVIQCIVLPVASDKTTQVGLSAASNGVDNFVSVTVRFSGNAVDFSGDLQLRLVDNNFITLEIVNSGLSIIGNSQVAQGVFLLSDEHLNKLKNSKIKTIIFKLKDGLNRAYQPEMNEDVLMKQVICL